MSRGIALDEVARIDADCLGWIRGLDATRREVAEAIDDAIERVRSEN